MRQWLAVALGLLSLRGSAAAQAPATGASWVEAGGFYHRVSSDFGDWRGGYFRDAVRSEQVGGAVTLGRAGRRLVAIRGGAGTEGYQLTGVSSTLRRFRSQEAGFSWREWTGARFGLGLGGELYYNPFYTRAGVSLGVFRGW